MSTRVAVVGSLNYDITVWVPQRPEADETVHGTGCEENAGGKGANQAVAAARLNAEVSMIGCVGADNRGDYLLAQLDAAGVDRTYVSRGNAATGTAVITIDPTDVSIIVIAGANGELGAKDAERAASAIADADVLLLQGEVGVEAARAAAVLAAASSTKIVFNPAPFNDVAASILPLADVVIVNRQEAKQLNSFSPPILITTLGADGCDVRIGEEITHVDAPLVEVVDPTGAGDAFNGGFSFAILKGKKIKECLEIANKVAGFSTTRLGAGDSMPTLKDINLKV